MINNRRHAMRHMKLRLNSGTVRRHMKIRLNSGTYISISHLLPAIEILRTHADMSLDDAFITIGCSRGQSELIKEYYASYIN